MSLGTPAARFAFLGALLCMLSAPALASEGGPDTFLGLPRLLWTTLNLVVFFGAIFILLAKPMSRFFHSRRAEIARQLAEATRQQEEAARLREEVEHRVADLEGEIVALRERLRSEGEKDKEQLLRQADEEASRLLAQLEQEAQRRVAEVHRELAGEAAAAAAEIALELVQREITQEDRERIFAATFERLRAGAPRGER
jgi:F-type H+-transporting ATPase subunit b